MDSLTPEQHAELCEFVKKVGHWWPVMMGIGSVMAAQCMYATVDMSSQNVALFDCSDLLHKLDKQWKECGEFAGLPSL